MDKNRIITIGYLLILALILAWYTSPTYVIGRDCQIASQEIKQAMQKMGPGKNYRILPDETLQVMINGEWQRFKY